MLISITNWKFNYPNLFTMFTVQRTRIIMALKYKFKMLPINSGIVFKYIEFQVGTYVLDSKYNSIVVTFTCSIYYLLYFSVNTLIIYYLLYYQQISLNLI